MLVMPASVQITMYILCSERELNCCLHGIVIKMLFLDSEIYQYIFLLNTSCLILLNTLFHLKIHFLNCLSETPHGIASVSEQRISCGGIHV